MLFLFCPIPFPSRLFLFTAPFVPIPFPSISYFSGDRHVSHGRPITACLQSIYNWRERFLLYRQTGNKESENVVGIHQLLLILFLIAYPECLLDELSAFIANASHDGKVYSRGELSQRLNELNITRKRGSAEAYQAFLPRNLLKRDIFWNHPFPFGVRGVARRRLIDIDECGIELQSCNRSSGFAYTGARVRKPGNYSRDVKVTVILAIEPGDPCLPPHVYGSVQNPRRWRRVEVVPGTTT